MAKQRDPTLADGPKRCELEGVGKRDAWLGDTALRAEFRCGFHDPLSHVCQGLPVGNGFIVFHGQRRSRLALIWHGRIMKENHDEIAYGPALCLCFCTCPARSAGQVVFALYGCCLFFMRRWRGGGFCRAMAGRAAPDATRGGHKRSAVVDRAPTEGRRPPALRLMDLT